MIVYLLKGILLRYLLLWDPQSTLFGQGLRHLNIPVKTSKFTCKSSPVPKAINDYRFWNTIVFFFLKKITKQQKKKKQKKNKKKIKKIKQKNNNIPSDMCTQRNSSQPAHPRSLISLRCQHKETLTIQNGILVRLHECADWSESSLGAHFLTAAHLFCFITKTYLLKYTENFSTKKWKFSDENSDIFHIFAQNIDCGYLLEPPRRGGSNEHSQSMFLSRKRTIMYTPVNPGFTV